MISLSVVRPHHAAIRRRFGARGFSLIELSLSVVVIGLIASTAASSYVGIFKNGGGQIGTDARLQSMSDNVIAFAKARNRLPCPDTTGNGFEALVAGACPAGTDVGWFPYLSIGLSQPAAAQRAIYGVYRNPLADLAASADLATLNIAAAQAPVSTYAYVTGDGTTTNGAENCALNVASNPAFVIMAPGEDRDRDGNNVDGIHGTLPNSGHCFAAPSRGVDTNFDDRTIAVGAYAMMAKLNP